MEVPEETLDQLKSIKAALDDLEAHMQPFLETSPKDMNMQLTPIERVKANLAMAQAVVVLFQLHRRLDAAKLEHHPIQKDLERLAVYERKVAAAINSDELARTKPGTSLNVAAANRFIDAAIPDLSAEQKQQLRSLGKRTAADAAAAAGASDSDVGVGGRKRQQQQQQQQQQAAAEQEAAGEAPPQEGQHTGSGPCDSDGEAAAAGPIAVGAAKKSSSSSSSKKKQRKSKAAAAVEEAQEFLQDVMSDLAAEG